MNLLPYEKFSIKTSLRKKQVIEELFPIVKQDISYRFLRSHKEPFYGKICDDGFSIKPTIGYSNAFIPLILGRLDEKNNQTTINISMRPILPVIIFTAIWMLACFSLFIVALYSLLTNTGEHSQNAILVVIIPLGMILY